MKLDFLNAAVIYNKKGVSVVPAFTAYTKNREQIKDILVKGGDFYAIWDESENRWQTAEYKALIIMDDILREYADGLGEEVTSIETVGDCRYPSIDRFHKFCQKQVRDNFVPLDCKISFLGEKHQKEEHISKSCSYSIPKSVNASDYQNWDKLVGTLYSEEERFKIEWAIGSIVSGDSVNIQKFIVFYGDAGSGKSTVMNIIGDMFKEYTCTFDANALTNVNNEFSLEPFKNNPLVAIQHDGDLSKITENTRLNSLVSHETMLINEKFKSKYEARFLCMLFVGTNRPVKITEAKSGLIRRLIDIIPSGNKLDTKEYNDVTKGVKYEYGAIAKHCLDVYSANKHAFDDYIPIRMMDATNDTYNFIVDNYRVFLKESENGIGITRIFNIYRNWYAEAGVIYPLGKRQLKEELRGYFAEFDNGYFKGLKTDKFEKKEPHKLEINEVEGNTELELPDWLKLSEQESYFDKECSDLPAQYATDTGKPKISWDKVTTKLSDIDSSKMHYVNLPENHIVIDFDMKDGDEKNLLLNLTSAVDFPETYAEISKSGNGLHLHYIYDGDPKKLSAIYDDKIEIKVYSGNQALRRKLTRCNNLSINHISSGLPLKKEKPMVDKNIVMEEKKMRNTILKATRKEIHPSTIQNMNFIKEVLDGAYKSGQKYDVSDLYDDIFTFCIASKKHFSQCMRVFDELKWKSDDVDGVPISTNGKKPLVFFDVEVFPNLLLICYKFQGNDTIYDLFNPTPEQIEVLLSYLLIGFNNRRYDNHIIYGAYMGDEPYDTYLRSSSIIKDSTGYLGQAWNASYTDIFDYMSEKMSLKKLEYKMGIDHDELEYNWDEPVPKELWPRIAEYCHHDVIATEAAFEYTKADFTGRQILADLAGMTVNDTTNTLTGRFIFGDEKEPQKEFIYRDLSKPVKREDLSEEAIEFLEEVFPDMMKEPHGEAKSILPYFPGYKFEFGKSTYLGDEVGEGGKAEGIPGYYTNVGLLDIMSMHPHSAMAEVIFGPRFTRAFYQVVYGRVHIKHKAWDALDGYLGGKLAPYIEKCKTGEINSKDLAYALKIAINSVYGLTAAHFDNLFRDPRNLDNIVAKRGALFMTELKYALRERGIIVAHIKTDSVKIPNATNEVIQYIMDFGKRYGYFFEHEATYEKMVLVNDAVYIAKYATPENCKKMYGYVPGDNEDHANDHRWTATGAQFQIPFIFKKLFSKEEITFEDMCSTFSVSKGALYLDFDEDIDIAKRASLESEYKKLKTLEKKNPDDQDIKNRLIDIKTELVDYHKYSFVGRVGKFVPIIDGKGAGVLYRIADGNPAAATGTTGYRWLEASKVKGTDMEKSIDISYWAELVNKAKDAICKYVPIDEFVETDVEALVIDDCPGDCDACGYLCRFHEAIDNEGHHTYVVSCELELIGKPQALKDKVDYVLNEYAYRGGHEILPF